MLRLAVSSGPSVAPDVSYVAVTAAGMQPPSPPRNSSSDHGVTWPQVAAPLRHSSGCALAPAAPHASAPAQTASAAPSRALRERPCI